MYVISIILQKHFKRNQAKKQTSFLYINGNNILYINYVEFRRKRNRLCYGYISKAWGFRHYEISQLVFQSSRPIITNDFHLQRESLALVVYIANFMYQIILYQVIHEEGYCNKTSQPA